MPKARSVVQGSVPVRASDLVDVCPLPKIVCCCHSARIPRIRPSKARISENNELVSPSAEVQHSDHHHLPWQHCGAAYCSQQRAFLCDSVSTCHDQKCPPGPATASAGQHTVSSRQDGTQEISRNPQLWRADLPCIDVVMTTLASD